MKPNIYFLRFCVQVGFSSAVLTFCIYQLLTGGIARDGKDGAIYWGGLTTILGWWMPTPASGRGEGLTQPLRERGKQYSVNSDANSDANSDDQLGR